MAEQRNVYKGRPPRPWLRMGFKASDGTLHELDLVADTGCPVEFILRPDLMVRLGFYRTAAINSNFGGMTGSWLRLYMPQLDLVEFVMGYASEQAARDLAGDHPDFVGLVGLPILRLGEYGGNGNEFWFRYPHTPTPQS